MVEEVNRETTAGRVQVVGNLVHSYGIAVEGLFDHVLPLLEEDMYPNRSYWLNHNGITNMIGPLYYFLKDSISQKGKPPLRTARILRALYSFETYQVMRRITRSDGPDGRTRLLDKRLGVDDIAHGSSLPEPYQESTPTFPQTAVVNTELLARLVKQHLWFIEYGTVLVPYLRAILEVAPHGVDQSNHQALTAAIKSTVEAVNTDSTSRALELEYPLEEFILYNVVEANLYTDKQSRVDRETNTPLLSDLVGRKVGQDMVQSYVTGRYEAAYKDRLREQRGQEF